MKHKRSIYHPKNWPMWLLVAMTWLLAKLSQRTKLAMGRAIGKLLQRLSAKVRRVTAVNIDLCFPSYNTQQKLELTNGSYQSAGMTVLESATSLWCSPKTIHNLLNSFSGVEHIEQGLRAGKGVLLFSPHLTTLEICGRIFAQQIPDLMVVYARQKNAVLDKINTWHLQRHYQQAIVREDIRGMIRALRNNKVLWFTPDVNASRRVSVFAPFFGVNAATVTATARYIQMSGALLLPVGFYRNDQGLYDIEIHPPVENFPTGDEIADATLINRKLEQLILKKPEQYMWQYRRFKTRPEGEPSFYR